MNKEKMLYAITAGSYSDYHIITLSSDKEKAEKLASLFGGDVEEYTENVYEESENDVVYSICIYEDGRFEIDDVTNFYKMKPLLPRQENVAYMPGYYSENGCYYTYVKTNKGVEVALKIATDRVAKYKAEHLGL